MKAFEFDNYRGLIEYKLEEGGQKAWGQRKKIADFLRVQISMVSQILSGKRTPSLELSLGICEYFGFTEAETDYFLSLVQVEKAGTSKLKERFQRQAQELKANGLELTHRLRQEKKLTEEARAIFYSQWYYVGIWALTSIPEFQTLESLSKATSLPRSKVERTMDFLLEHGLCKEEDGCYSIGPRTIHLERTSPLIGRHHTNWRFKIIESLENSSAEDLLFTGPVTIAESDIPKVREILVDSIDKIMAIVHTTEPERLTCLNIDWVKFF